MKPIKLGGGWYLAAFPYKRFSIDYGPGFAIRVRDLLRRRVVGRIPIGPTRRPRA